MIAVMYACSGDEPDSPGKVSELTMNAIKETFPGLRVDSIGSYYEYGNIKLTYESSLLVSYKECYDDGRIHDGVNFTLKYEKDTVRLYRGNVVYRAAIGPNGCVKELICPTGRVNYYSYDDARHLLKYDIEIKSVSSVDYHEITWENGNVVHFRRTYTKEDGVSTSYCDYYYTYDSQLNHAGLLPPLRCVYQWIDDCGVSVGYGVNNALYYAGLLGVGTKNLPITSRNRYESGQQNQTYKFYYELDDDGYVVSASNGYLVKDNFFYR